MPTPSSTCWSSAPAPAWPRHWPPTSWAVGADRGEVVATWAARQPGPAARCGYPASPVLARRRGRRHRGAGRHLPAIPSSPTRPRRSGWTGSSTTCPPRSTCSGGPPRCGCSGPGTIPITTPRIPVVAQRAAPAKVGRSTPRFSANIAHGYGPASWKSPHAHHRRRLSLAQSCGRVPRKGTTDLVKRVAQGVGGLLVGRRYAAGGQALAAGLFAGVLSARIPIWTDTALVRLMATTTGSTEQS